MARLRRPKISLAMAGTTPWKHQTGHLWDSNTEKVHNSVRAQMKQTHASHLMEGTPTNVPCSMQEDSFHSTRSMHEKLLRLIIHKLMYCIELRKLFDNIVLS